MKKLILFFTVMCFCCVLQAQREESDYLIYARRGNSNAQYRLGDYYFEGNGRPKDLIKAVYWYTKAAIQGNTEAQHKLERCHAYGDDTGIDLKKAAYWYARAEEEEDAEAQNNLGFCYFKGKGIVEVNKKMKAAYWWAKAARQQYAVAQYNIARALDNVTSLGIDLGLNADGNTALFWYKESLRNGLVGDGKSATEIAVKELTDKGYFSSKGKSNITVAADEKPLLIVAFYIIGFVIFLALDPILGARKRKKNCFK
jgi:TPR repeat protein